MSKAAPRRTLWRVKCERCGEVEIATIVNGALFCESCAEPAPVDGLYRVVAPSFVAGFVVARGVVVKSASILRRFVQGRPVQEALESCDSEGWEVEVHG